MFIRTVSLSLQNHYEIHCFNKSVGNNQGAGFAWCTTFLPASGCRSVCNNNTVCVLWWCEKPCSHQYKPHGNMLGFCKPRGILKSPRMTKVETWAGDIPPESSPITYWQPEANLNAVPMQNSGFVMRQICSGKRPPPSPPCPPLGAVMSLRGDQHGAAVELGRRLQQD